MPKHSNNNYTCEICDFICSKKSNYDIHLLTAKHQHRTLLNTENAGLNFACKHCNKVYKARNSLWYHEKKCIHEKKYNNTNHNTNHTSHTNHNTNYNNNNTNHNTNNTNNTNNNTNHNTNNNNITLSPDNIDVNLILNLMKQNQEFKLLIIEQQEEFKKYHIETQKHQDDTQNQILEIVKDNIGIHHINSHNKITNNFNLNVFLNETCKDAMNLSDFIDSIKVKFEDIEYTGENGFAAGVSRIFLQELNKLEICKRPIHCSDVKREIFHIKDQNTWEKERKMLVKVIQQITRKNIVLLVDWRLAHPGCMEYRNKMNNKYDKINGECLGPYKDDEELRDYNRIITNVAKATIIDKKPICNL